MKKPITKLFVCVFTFLIFTSAMADNKILVAGDSWGAFMCAQNSFTDVFEQYQDPIGFNHAGCWVSTKMGMRAEKWLQSSQHKKTLSFLKKDKNIKVLFLSLGGNDLINYVNKDMSETQLDSLFEYIYQHIHMTIQSYKEVRPDLKIIVSGYDFPRFIDNHPVSAYKKAYAEMGKPSPEELNQVLIRFSQHLTKITNGTDVAYIHHLGVMHYFDGNPEVGLGKNQTLHPDLISHPLQPAHVGGRFQFQSSKSSMFKVTSKLIDAFHLDREGYYRLAEHTYRLYLRRWLNN